MNGKQLGRKKQDKSYYNVVTYHMIWFGIFQMLLDNRFI